MQLLAIVIPVFNLSGHRLRNFKFILDRILAVKFNEVIVVEQVKVDKSSLDLPKNIKHIRVASSSNLIEKSKLINHAVSMTEAEYVWIHDADVYVSFQDVIKSIESVKSYGSYPDVVNPFKYLIKLDDNDDTEEFIKQKKSSCKKRKSIYHPTAGSFIIKKREFIRIRGMDENYIGWGGEDTEFAKRLSLFLRVITFDHLKGVHLYHDKEFDPLERNAIRKNVTRYKSSIDKMSIDIDKYINSIKSPFDKIQISKLVHIVSPVCNQSNKGLIRRQSFAMESIEKSKQSKSVLKIAAFVPTEYDDGKGGLSPAWDTVRLSRDAESDIGHNRPLPFLLDMLDNAYEHCSLSGIIIYSNIDCIISENFYKNIETSKRDYIEFYRQDINGIPSKYEDAFTLGKAHILHGVDAFAISARFYAKIRHMIPDLVIGEPYWDAVISGLMKEHTNVSQNTTDLFHIRHETTWDMNELNCGGQHNRECLDDLFNSGLITHTQCEIRAKTIIVRAHSEKDTDYDVAFEAFSELRNIGNVNHILIEFLTGYQKSKFTDQKLGTTGCRRILIKSNGVFNLRNNFAIMQAVADEKWAEYFIFLDEHYIFDNTTVIDNIKRSLQEDPLNILTSNTGVNPVGNKVSTTPMVAMTREKLTNMLSDHNYIFNKSLKKKDVLKNKSIKCKKSNFILPTVYNYLPISQLYKTKTDTACIIATFHQNKNRILATKYAFLNWLKQSLTVKFVWLELLFDDEESCLPTMISKHPFVKHIIIHGCKSNKRIFQKEALWNIGARYCKDIDFLYFMDADLFCENKDWFARIHEILSLDPNAIVQPGQSVLTVKPGDPEIKRSMQTWTGFYDNVNHDLPSANISFAPCGVVCMTSNMFNSIGCFNPFGIMYGGDTIFLIETNQKSHAYYNYFMYNTAMKNIIRNNLIQNDQIRWRGTDDEIIHVYHGEYTNRAYSLWGLALTNMYFDFNKFLEVDKLGLVSWKSTNPIFNYIYDRRDKINNKSICYTLLTEAKKRFASFYSSIFNGSLVDLSNLKSIWTLNADMEFVDGYLVLKYSNVDKPKYTSMITVIKSKEHFFDTNRFSTLLVEMDVNLIDKPNVFVSFKYVNKNNDLIESERLKLHLFERQSGSFYIPFDAIKADMTTIDSIAIKATNVNSLLLKKVVLIK